MNYLVQPYTFVNKIDDKVILYNTITGNKFEFFNNEHSNLFDSSSFINRRIISLPYGNTHYSNLFKDMLEDFAIIETNNSKNVTWKPILNIQESPEKIISNIGEYDGIGILKYLSEVSFFLNDFGNDFSIEDYSKQILTPKKSSKNHQLRLCAIKKTINNILPYISKVNFLAGSFKNYPEFIQLMDILRQFDCKQIVHIHYKESDLKTPKHVERNIIIDNTISEVELNKLIVSKEYNSLIFIITSQEDFETYSRLIEVHEICNFSFSPAVTNATCSLIKSMEFSADDIFETKFSFNDIYTKQTLNENNFGKLFIYSDGSSKTSLSGKDVGNIYETEISKIIYNEIAEQQDWFLTRRKFKPCNKCIYNNFCPSVSDYERLINKPLCVKELQPLTFCISNGRESAKYQAL